MQHPCASLVARLLRSVLRVSSEGGELVLPDATTPAGAQALDEALRTLGIHGLLPLVCTELGAQGRLDELPAAAVTLLQSASRTSFVENGVRMSALASVLPALRRRSIEPVVLKGAALVNTLYPSLGCRPMGDIDLLVEPDEFAAACAVVEQHGFQRRVAAADSVTFRKASGAEIDLHHRFRIFDGLAREGLTTTVKPRFLPLESLRILEPNASVVHLSAHLHGHRPKTGFILVWLYDLALVLRDRGAELRVERMRELARGETAWLRIRCLASFLQRELGVPLPEALAAEVEGLPSVDFAEVLRSRRLALWGLPAPLGWLRLAAHVLRLKAQRRKPPPLPADLLLWIPDRLRAARRG